MRTCGKNRYSTQADAEAAFTHHPRRKAGPYAIVWHARCGGWHIVPESEAARFTVPPWAPDPERDPGRCQICDVVSDGCSAHPRDPATVVWDTEQRRYIPA